MKHIIIFGNDKNAKESALKKILKDKYYSEEYLDDEHWLLILNNYIPKYNNKLIIICEYTFFIPLHIKKNSKIYFYYLNQKGNNTNNSNYF